MVEQEHDENRPLDSWPKQWLKVVKKQINKDAQHIDDRIGHN